MGVTVIAVEPVDPAVMVRLGGVADNWIVAGVIATVIAELTEAESSESPLYAAVME
jgi:hypothetical protein